MKKLIAMALALVMSCGVMTACGDKDDDKKEITKKPAAEEVVEEEKIADSLLNYENASLKFTKDMDLSWIYMMNEVSNELYPGDEGYAGGEAVTEIMVEELEGMEMLKFNVVPEADGTYKTAKIKFDMDKLFEGKDEKLDAIFAIKLDMIAVAKDEIADDEGNMLLVPAWNGGAIGTKNNSAWNGNLLEWSIDEWTKEWGYLEAVIKPGATTDNANSQKFDSTFDTNLMVYQQWGIQHDVDIYIADIVFLDADNNVITLD